MAIDDIAQNAIEIATDPGIPSKSREQQEMRGVRDASPHAGPRKRPAPQDTSSSKVSGFISTSFIRSEFNVFRGRAVLRRCVWIMQMYRAWISTAVSF